VNPVDQALEGLWKWAAATGIALDRQQQLQVRQYLDVLLLWNRRVSMVSQNDPQAIVCKHFADSLVAAAPCDPRAAVVDLGTGAGFPGLVIAIARPAARVTLIESKQKKVSFLLEVIRSANIENARTVETRIESAARDPEHTGQYLVAISRALSDLPGFLALAAPFLSIGGIALAMKGPTYSTELRMFSNDDLERAGFATPQSYRYQLPDGAERALLSFRRI